DRSAVETAITELRGVMDTDNKDKIAAKSEELGRAAMKLGEAMYRQTGDTEPKPAESGAAEDRVVDADFEEVKDDDRKRSQG
ncbi:MAG: molecular chaperone DnaK, partial [Chitinophagales bacterium]|nr:molecular chaperone DnaK [Hyphomicrobiales bacterium]